MRIRKILVIQLIVLTVGAASEGFRDIPGISKLLLSALFVFTAVAYAQRDRSPERKYVLVAMLFCFAGDLATSGLVPGGLLSAMGLFAVAQIVFLRFFIRKAGEIKKPGHGLLAALPAWYMPMFILVWWRMIVPSDMGALFIAGSFVYGMLLSVMAMAAAILAQRQRVWWPAAVGAGLFWVSDTLIAVSHTQHIHGLNGPILLTYFLALTGLIHGADLLKRD